VLARAVGLWGVALSTLVTDVVMLAGALPMIVASAAGTTTRALLWSILRPFAPAVVVGAGVLVGLARWWEPHTLPTLALLGALWLVLAGAALWRFGLAESERTQFGREFLHRRAVPVDI
jgi:hypothetical protein